MCNNVTLEHKTSLKGKFFAIESYASSESWINHISIDVWFGQYLKIWCKKNLNIEKIIFKVVQMKFLAMHIIKFWYIYGRIIFMEHDLYLILNSY